MEKSTFLAWNLDDREREKGREIAAAVAMADMAFLKLTGVSLSGLREKETDYILERKGGLIDK